MKRRYSILILLFYIPLSAQALSLQTLKDHYFNIKSITAEVKQTKTAPYLFKPILSQIILTYEKNKISWQTKTPTKQTLIIQNNELFSISEKGILENIPLSKSPQGAKLIGFFKSLFSMDFDSIQRSFQLSFKEQQMVAIPKKDSGLNFIDKMSFYFDKNLNISSVVIEAGQEKTQMVFSNVITGTK